jgi:hypothetical protein
MCSPDCKFVPSHSSKLGQTMLKSCIQTLVLDNLGESSTSLAMILWCCWMVPHHFRTRCTSSVSWLVKFTFYAVSFFKNIYITMSLSSNGRGDITSRPLLWRIITMVICRVFWFYFLLQKIYGWEPHKSRHPFSLSLSLS